MGKQLEPKDPYDAMLKSHYKWNAKQRKREAAREMAAYGDRNLMPSEKRVIRCTKKLRARALAKATSWMERGLPVELLPKNQRKWVEAVKDHHMCLEIRDIDERMLRNAI